jgi:hypothetical protein
MIPFDLYIVGTVQNIPELVERHEPAVISEFPVFCETHLKYFINKCEKADRDSGPDIARLANAWKQTIIQSLTATHQSQMDSKDREIRSWKDSA